MARGRGLALVAGISMGKRKGAAQAQAQQQMQATQQQAAAADQRAQQAQQEAQAVKKQLSDQQTAKSNLTDEIQKLAQLHQSGALTDDEFAAAKQKLLNG